MWFVTLIVILLIALVWITRIREGFIDTPTGGIKGIEGIPEPREMFKMLRALLDKYDKPAIWGHATEVMDKDPGQLARMALNINNA